MLKIIFKLIFFFILIFNSKCYFNLVHTNLSDQQNYISQLFGYLNSNVFQSSNLIQFKIDQDIANIENYNLNNSQLTNLLRSTIRNIIFNEIVDNSILIVDIQNTTGKDQKKRILSNYSHINILQSYELLNTILDLNIVYVISIEKNLGITAQEISTLITNDVQNGNFMKHFDHISYSLYQINSFNNSSAIINSITNISNSTFINNNHGKSSLIPYNFNNTEIAGIVIALMIIIMLLLTLMFYFTDMRCDSVFNCYYDKHKTKVIPVKKEP